MDNPKLFTDFPPIKTESWESVIKTDLRGADYNKKLIWKTQDGFPVKPYYRAEDLNNKSILNSEPGLFPFIRGNKTSSNNWDVRFIIEVNDPSESNKKALYFLNRGVSSLGFSFSSAFFLKTIPSRELVSKLFEGIFLDCIEIGIHAGIHSLDFLKLLSE